VSRILVVTDDFPPAVGGVALFAGAIARGLADDGRPLRIYGRLRRRYPDGLPFVGVPGPSFGRFGHLWTRAVLAMAPGDRVIAVHAATAAALVGPARRRGVPLDVIVHGSEITDPGPSWPRVRATLRAARRIYAPSRYLLGVLRQRGFDGYWLPSPVDPGPTIAEPPTTRRWALVARATPLKAGDRFVRLVAAAGVEGLVIGDGPALPAWRALARQVGARVEFVGALAPGEVSPALQTCDLAMLLSRPGQGGEGAEGLGLCLLEAAARGLAVVGSPTGGIPEAVGPGGLVLDDPDDLDGSLASIARWWNPRRGAEAQAWLAQTHGTRRTLDTLDGAPR
jgi:glycosyltransferase involved in cell wall biosynthesis